MKPENLRLILDKRVQGIARFEETNFRGEKPYSNQIRKDMKEFTVQALEGMLKEIETYGKNTHIYQVALEYLVKFRQVV